MNNKALFAGLAVAAVGVVLLFLYMRRYEAEASGGAPVQILMVTRDVAAGEPVTQEDLGIRTLPSDYLEDRNVRAADSQRVIGIASSHQLRANQNLLWTDLTTSLGGVTSVSSVLGEGMRAVSISGGQSGRGSIVSLVQPGDRVDILFTGARPGDEEGEEVTVTLLQNVLVVAVGTDINGNAGRSARSNDITLAVTVAQATLLTHAADTGSLEFTLRNPDDIDRTDSTQEVTSVQIIQPAARRAAQMRRAQPAPPTSMLEQITN